ncbi:MULTISPECIES: crotonase/enoyl-CoA hydratase family protein [Pseudonocardia]|uniref:Carnitinyl-CoA dehydratase n=2 Tax=Pseudonocardia TaxID=1847 RepID=A0A1Y2MWN7_PSEAH|nr:MULTISPECIES: crotonase/enoyl-CoA hydratase family protein [Pseudonocardia]OSY39582.1 Carnitinyl-CoA dehydratase [Pseudonocardia autotrophica]TDN72713.1 enoyl-CoA hydratase [Pseudonocardia autotrophica]BBG03428.1 putative enoyl-coa hydratase/isomerase [Pseudonocardia autotrophica]GEC24848.1 putative enoyl-coa hydratase/isomerase [Pseudonocardia saturnea]
MIRTEKADDVWTIVHSRFDEARNAMDPASADALVEAMLEFDADPTASVAVLWGEGGAFCAGWDLKFASTLQDRDSFQQQIVEDLGFPSGANRAPRGPLGPTRLELSKPVIAAVEGPAVAGGMELAIWCDMRVMADDAYFGVYCRRWGIPLLDGGSVRLPRLVGQGRAMEIILTGRQVPADEAYRIGLCEKVTASGGARAEAEALAREIARFPQAAVRADRRSAIESYGLPIRDAMRREWSNGVEAHYKEGAAGAGRFASGRGRHGDFAAI